MTSGPPFTHEGAPASLISPESQLRRSVLSCLLWEDEFYENGKAIAERISRLARQLPVETVAALADEARNRHGLRRVPFLLLTEIILQGGPAVAQAIEQAIRRPDDMTALLEIYWRDGKWPLSAQMKKGLAAAFGTFSEYQLAKYDRDGPVRLRDVMFMVHPKPVDAEQEALFRRVAERKLATPDTWETALSAGENRRKTFERLIREGKLGYLALLRNLRNMMEAGCDRELVKRAILARKGAELVFPFRYVAAARACPELAETIDQALCQSLADLPEFDGVTAVLVDVSHSMNDPLSAKSDLTRMDAAATLAAVMPGTVRIFTFSTDLKEVTVGPGLKAVEAIRASQPHLGTQLRKALRDLNERARFDRLIIITDEQSGDTLFAPPVERAYLINVASNRNGIGYGEWIHIDGFSEAVLRFIAETEKAGA